jgi:hypothetical protein
MRRTMRASLAGFTALAAAVVLAGCGTGGAPAPAPSTESPTATAAPPVETSAPVDPTTIGSLPGSAFLRVSAVAEAGGEEVRLQLTFSRAATKTTQAEAFQAVLDECPNAIQSQLDIFTGFEPTGVIVSKLETEGDWPEGITFAVAAGGQIASIGEGRNVAPSTDEPGMFGCTVPIITGPGDATFTSLLLGEPAVNDRTDFDRQLERGLFGFESDSGSAEPIRWRDCVIQLSSSAQRFATENGWVLPGEWGDGCLIGDGGTV